MTDRRIHIKPISKPLPQERLYERVDVKGPDECWPWMAARMTAGYGSFYRDKKHILAHRDAYEKTYGQIPEGLHVLHHCDNPPCCNPRHLFLGTQKDNNQDKISKGRQASGECHGMAKFSDEIIAQAVAACRNREGSQTVIAKRFGISQSHLSTILSGKLRGILR